MYHREDYPYLYETHLHTSNSSACAKNSGYDMAKAAHQYGYAGIFVTDHNWGGNNAIDPNLSWRDWVYAFTAGYRDAKRYAEEHPDFDVFFAYEAGFSGTEFLIYGISPQWLMDHPQIRDASLEEHLQMVRDSGGVVIHAHPFRQAGYIKQMRLYPQLVHGVEGINATHSNSKSMKHNDKAYDARAVEYAHTHNLLMSAGSDVHGVDIFGGGVALRRRLRSVEDFCRVLLNNEDRLLTNGEEIYDKNGLSMP